MPELDEPTAKALRILDDAYAEIKQTPYAQDRLQLTIAGLPDVSLGEAERRTAVGIELLERIGALEDARLSHKIELAVRAVRYRAQMWAREAPWYWLVVDPRGIGQFGLFLPTSYCGASILTFAHKRLGAFPIARPEDCGGYLGLMTQYGALVDQFADRTSGQAERGIFMPKAQVKQARVLLRGFRTWAENNLVLSQSRTSGLDNSQSLLNEQRERLESGVLAAYDRALSGIDEAYYAEAPDQVGMAQYPNGPDVYAELVQLHTTLELSPREVHSRGLKRMREIEASIAEIRREFGFGADHEGFLRHLDQDQRWRATTEDGVTSVFQRYIDRIKPVAFKHFSHLPEAKCSVVALAPELQPSMTFGFYDPPTTEKRSGEYMFNVANLTRQPLFNLAALTFHELLPGHHLQVGLHLESADLHPFQKLNYVTSYIEGWAEYAATFAGEQGMYEEPEERYGRLMLDAFLSCRLVVDTGMNAMGWSLEQARDYMRRHSGMDDGVITTESIRYSCDIPGQALAYKLGDEFILNLRDRMQSALGDSFTPKLFHDCILAAGPVAFPDLAWHVEHVIGE